MPKACPSCRQENPDTQSTCTACGARLDLDPLRAAAAAAAAQPANGPEGLLWAGRTSFLNSLGGWVLYGLLVVGVLVLYFMFDSKAHPRMGYFLGILAWIIILPPGLWLAGKTLYIRWSTRYRLTEERLFIDRGLLARVTDQTELIRVDDVRVKQGPVQRLLGLGDVIIMSTDASDKELVIPGIDNPTPVAEHVRNQMRKLRKRGLYVESL